MERAYKIIKLIPRDAQAADSEERRRIIKDLAENLRRQDQDEMRKLNIAACGFEREIKESVDFSQEAYVAVDRRGRVITIYGVIEKEGEIGGQIWCLGSNLFPLYKRNFVRDVGKVLDRWKKRYKALWNYVSAENSGSIRWLAACGARFKKGYMAYGHEFWRFDIGEN